MKNSSKILLIILLVTTIIATMTLIPNITNNSVVDDMARPKTKTSYVNGTWKLLDKKILSSKSEGNLNDYSSEYLYISNDVVAYDNRYALNPNFKSRYLNLKDILKLKYNASEGIINSIQNEGVLVTVSDGQFFYQEIMVIDDSHISFVYDGIYFYFEKISDNISNEIIDDIKNKIEANKHEKSSDSNLNENMCVFINVRDTATDDYSNTYTKYKTYMLKKDLALGKTDAYAISDIFLNRKTGFWIIGSEHDESEASYKDYTYAYPVAESNKNNEKFVLGKKGNSQIQFISSDYLSLASYDYDVNMEESYGIYEIDSLKDNQRLSIEKIGGELGKEAFVSSTLKELNGTVTESNVKNSYDSSNIGLKRINGTWKFKSNILIMEENHETVTDYIIDLVPIIDLFNENSSVGISWNTIRTKLPSAIDAYTSTKDNYLVVQNQYELSLYDVNNGIIGDNPIITIKTGQDERILNIQWVFADQANEWAEAFLKQNIIPVETVITPDISE